MTDNEIIIECAKLDGWKTTRNPKVMVKMEGDVIKLEAHVGGETLQSYLHSRDAIVPVRLKVINTPELKVKWLNAAREIVGRRCARNKAGTPIVSDFDLASITAAEDCEATLKATGKWGTE